METQRVASWFFAVAGVLMLSTLVLATRCAIVKHDDKTKRPINVATEVATNEVPYSESKRDSNSSPQIIEARTPKQSHEESFRVYIIADGKQRVCMVRGKTVRDALRYAGIMLTSLDRISPAPSTKLRNGLTIRIERVRITEERQYKVLQPPTKIRFDKSKRATFMKVINPGKPGIMEVVVRVYRKDGRVTLRKVISRQVVKPPKPKVVVVGTYYTPPSRGLPIAHRVLTMVATAYYPGPRSCGRFANGLTATGIKARRGVVAVDPRVIPLGSRLYVEGYGFAIAADTGSAIKGNRIDVCFNTYREAKRWGRRTVRVLVLAQPGRQPIRELLQDSAGVKVNR